MAANTLNNETRSQFQFKMGIWAVSIIFIVTAAGQCLCVSQAWGKGLSRGGNQIWHQDVGIFGKAEEDDAFGKAVASGDFNGDGYDDLAVGADRESISGISGAGAVNVIYGTSEGLFASGNQIWHQDSAGILGEAVQGDHFGASLASGDFNGDGYDDLAVGAIDEDIGEISSAGAVNVIYGTAEGLAAFGNQIWYQNISGIQDASEAYDHFGESIASGDFNGDGYDDLAVGVSSEDIGEISGGGAVNIIYGTAEGLAASGNQMWHQNSPGILGETEIRDYFGSAVASADFNNDGYDDLAVGAKGEDIGEISGGGAVNIIYGTAEGLAASGNQMWHQNSTGILGGAEHSDYFGAAVASGDFNGDAYDDLAVGVSSESIGEIFRAGAVNVIYGASEGLAASGNQMWHQDSPGILGGAETNDVFGESLASGDFDGDGYDDLAVGAKGEYIGDIPDAGMVNVIYGTSEGLASSGNQIWHQDITDIAGEAQGYDHFGNSVAAGNFNGDRSSDLAVGAYTDKLPSGIHAGAVNVFYSVPDPVTPPAIILFLLNKDQ